MIDKHKKKQKHGVHKGWVHFVLKITKRSLGVIAAHLQDLKVYAYTTQKIVFWSFSSVGAKYYGK